MPAAMMALRWGPLAAAAAAVGVAALASSAANSQTLQLSVMALVGVLLDLRVLWMYYCG